MNELWDFLKDLSFDESDKNLFQVDDPRLRADALKFSILLRMKQVLHLSIDLINTVFDVDALKESHISSYPAFRTNRKNELTHCYESAFVSLHGKMSKTKWKGLKRQG